MCVTADFVMSALRLPYDDFEQCHEAVSLWIINHQFSLCHRISVCEIFYADLVIPLSSQNTIVMLVSDWFRLLHVQLLFRHAD